MGHPVNRRVTITCTPETRAAVDASLAAAGLASEVAWVQSPMGLPSSMPPVETWWAGLQGPPALVAAVAQAVEAGGGKAYRGKADSVDDDTVPVVEVPADAAGKHAGKDPTELRWTRDAALADSKSKKPPKEKTK